MADRIAEVVRFITNLPAFGLVLGLFFALGLVGATYWGWRTRRKILKRANVAPEVYAHLRRRVETGWALFLGAGGVLLVFLMWIGTITAMYIGYGNVGDGPGTFGDMFGALTSLFTGLGLVGLMVTLAFQAAGNREAQAQFARQMEQQQDALGEERRKARIERDHLEKQLQLARAMYEIEKRREEFAARPVFAIQRPSSEFHMVGIEHRFIAVQEFYLRNMGAPVLVEEVADVHGDHRTDLLGGATVLGSDNNVEFKLEFIDQSHTRSLQVRFVQLQDGKKGIAHYDVLPMRPNPVFRGVEEVCSPPLDVS
jgi:hypothetical protein